MRLSVQVVARTGGEADLIVGTLTAHGIAAKPCGDVWGLLEKSIAEPSGPLLFVEEMLTGEATVRLREMMRVQPAWSDLPILILASDTAGRRVQRGWEDSQPGCPMLIEGPIGAAMPLNLVRAAVRARTQQYEMRDALLARETALAELLAERDALRHSEERFRRLIENSSVCINISDTKGHIFYGNPTLLRLIGYTAEDVAQGLVRWDQLTPPEFADADRRATEQLLATGTCDLYQKAYRARDGRLIPLLVGMTLLPPENGEHPEDQVAVFLTDLTSQKQAETALVQSEKLAAVGRLAASISHEINNPLEAVTNLLYLIQREELSEETRGYLATADRELTRVSQIATHTLRFHRQSTKPREIAPEELIRAVVALYQGRLSNSQIEIVYEHRGAGEMTCYEGDIRQVLNNLLENAIDSMRTGGRLIVRTRGCTFWSTGTRGVRITVADSGHGMSAEVRARIFDAFYTTKESSGTGLGLWISKGIIDKHEGRLQVKSSDRLPRRGSVFSLFLPREVRPKVREAE